MIVVDDHTLVAVLAEDADPELQRRADGNEVFTTGSWYYRVARAARDRDCSGSLSRRIESLPPEARQAVMASLDNLPPQIGLQSPRILVPVMAKLSSDIRRLNHLNAETLASALVLEGDPGLSWPLRSCSRRAHAWESLCRSGPPDHGRPSLGVRPQKSGMELA